MTYEKIRELCDAMPFQPFIIHIAGGRQIPVHHREFMALAPSRRTVIVFQPDDSHNVIDLTLVSDLEVSTNRAPAAG